MYLDKFPPDVIFEFKPSTNLCKYSFSYQGGKYPREIAHLLFYILTTRINNREMKVLHIDNLAKSFHPYFAHEHIGTELLNSALLDLSAKWNICPDIISGKLAVPDAENGNWRRSIPFYSDFPKHLHKRIPYRLHFHLYQGDSLIIVPESPIEREIFIEQLITHRTALHFKYEKC